jgi:predicted  nucleic acid-binding Zn-ribbon protein
VFDEFTLATHTDEIQRLSERIEGLNETVHSANNQVAQLEKLERASAEQLKITNEQLRRVNKSLTWRLIKPFVFLRYPDYRAKQKSKLARILGISAAE